MRFMCWSMRALKWCRFRRRRGGRISGPPPGEASWAIGTIVVIFGGIYGGVFTPTEAAGVAVIYSLFVAMIVYREVGLAELGGIIVSSVVLISQILIIVTGAGIYSWLMTTSGIPQKPHQCGERAAVAELANAAVRQWRTVDRRQLS